MQEEMQRIHSSSEDHQERESWAIGVCYTPWCQQRQWFVRRCAEHQDAWRVALTPDEEGWLVAADGPLCPRCGGTLLMPTYVDGRAFSLSSWS